ncbi:MAG: hypothetical protein Terrestrivirus1_164 [Terrestrivirus sp.]|uniref:Uncharacterized protein n=1 Tax=Terrestrivirus sp. TaxID=2487775 RepID=A0A3G4ZKC7_9VIRU|nr:MAG: hypothetical protein Terrestrivirus1_164 [Terrestrivirus sp.]
MSSAVPCYEAYILASLTVSCATIAALFALISFGMYSLTLHFNPNRKFVTTTKYDIESASWVLVLSAIGALSASSAVIYNFNCGVKCTSAEISCVTSMGTFGASFVAAFSAMCAAILKLTSLYFQLKHPQIPQDAQSHQISVPVTVRNLS